MLDVATSYIDDCGIPRCGCPDFNLSSTQRKWGHSNLTYFIVNRDSDLNADVWDKLILEAFSSWSRVADLTFRQIDRDGSANIMIDIGAGQGSHFDGPKGTLAWAYLPSKDNYTGQLLMKFDTDEVWSDGNTGDTLLRNVAAHEIGHILGLSHSSQESALMAPYYSASVFEPQENDDIPRIQELYGKP